MLPKVTIIIPTRGKLAFVKQCLRTLFKSLSGKEAEVDVIVIEGGGEESKALIEKEYANKSIRWMKAEDGWSFSKINNVAAETTTADYILFLNNDIICKADFLGQMLTVMDAHNDVGIVGAKLLHKDGDIQHVGVVFDSRGVPTHLGYGKPDDGSFGPTTRDDYYDAVTFACALVRRPVWIEAGGMDEAYHFNYEDIDFCLKARIAGWRCYLAHRAVLIHLEGKSGEYRKTQDHSLWRNLKIFKEKWITTGNLATLTNCRIQKDHGSLREDRLNIAFIPSAKHAGVPWWRIELPARKIAKLGLANVQVIYADSPDTLKSETLKNAHVIVFQGMSSEWVVSAASLGRQRGFTMVYDYDDHPIHISPFSQAYKAFGCQEIMIADSPTGGDWLWRDGQNGFDLKRNLEDRARQMEIFSKVDLITTTTRPLQSFFSTYNPNVKMLQNCIDFDLYRPASNLFERKKGPLRIGWHGGDNHFHDVSTIGKPLVEFVNSHDVQMVFFGAYYRGAFKGIDPNKVIEDDWIHVEAFPWKLQTLGIDIALIPLADPALPFMAFNHTKSNIKLLENSALKIPSLVQAGRAAYHDARDGDNCLTFASDDEFKDKLNRLYMDSDLRKSLANRAHDYVREYYNLEKNAHLWVEAYQQIHDSFEPKEVVEEDVNIRASEEGLRIPESSAVSEGASA